MRCVFGQVFYLASNGIHHLKHSRATACMRKLSHHEAIVVQQLHENYTISVQLWCNYRSTLQEVNMYRGIPLTFFFI